jgi:hypothetical protein
VLSGGGVASEYVVVFRHLVVNGDLQSGKRRHVVTNNLFEFLGSIYIGGVANEVRGRKFVNDVQVLVVLYLGQESAYYIFVIHNSYALLALILVAQTPQYR